MGGTGVNLTAANHVVITNKFWELNEQGQAFAKVVRLGQNIVPHTGLMNAGPGGYNHRPSDLQQQSGVAQQRILDGLMRRPNITTSMIYRILEALEHHTKRLTEIGDTLQSDEPFLLEC